MSLDLDVDVDHNKDASIPAMTITDPPIMTSKPVTYSGCCLALSTPLLEHIHSLLGKDSSKCTLSIGSGFGLLEALLRNPPYSQNVIGVEVEPSPNRYLSAEGHRVVHGSRFLEPLAADATTWLFVYPRRPGLVKKYLAEYGAKNVEQIIWIGPQADWDDYASCFDGWQVQSCGADDVGGRAWELISVARRRRE